MCINNDMISEENIKILLTKRQAVFFNTHNIEQISIFYVHRARSFQF